MRACDTDGLGQLKENPAVLSDTAGMHHGKGSGREERSGVALDGGKIVTLTSLSEWRACTFFKILGHFWLERY